jgi:hypothetical protein
MPEDQDFITPPEPMPEGAVCGYSLKHAMAKIPAVTVINCGPVGVVATCQRCADFYNRMSA